MRMFISEEKRDKILDTCDHQIKQPAHSDEWVDGRCPHLCQRQDEQMVSDRQGKTRKKPHWVALLGKEP